MCQVREILDRKFLDVYVTIRTTLGDVYVAVRTIFGGMVGRLYVAAQPKLQKNLDCFRMYAGQF